MECPGMKNRQGAGGGAFPKRLEKVRSKISFEPPLLFSPEPLCGAMGDFGADKA